MSTFHDLRSAIYSGIITIVFGCVAKMEHKIKFYVKVDARCSLENQTVAMDVRDRWQKRESGNSVLTAWLGDHILLGLFTKGYLISWC